MRRITRRDLDGVCDRINRGAGFDAGTPLWRRQDGRNIATVGMFYIDGAYGGWALYRMVNEDGGVEDVFNVGHVPARELYGLLHAFIIGKESERKFWGRFEGP
jgi:hypothetical protein